MKAMSSPGADWNKSNYMNDKVFEDLKKALEDALAFERGERYELHVTRIRDPCAEGM